MTDSIVFLFLTKVLLGFDDKIGEVGISNKRGLIMNIKEAKKKVEEAEKVLTEAKKLLKESQSKVWVPGSEPEHFFISSTGSVSSSSRPLANPGNSFPSEEVAEEVYAYNEVIDKMRIAANGFVKGNRAWGYFIRFDSGYLKAMNHWEYFDFGTIYFETKQEALDFINSLTEGEKEILKKGRPVY